MDLDAEVGGYGIGIEAVERMRKGHADLAAERCLGCARMTMHS